MISACMAMIAGIGSLHLPADGPPSAPGVSSGLSVTVRTLTSFGKPAVQLTLTNVSKRYRIVGYGSGDVAWHCKAGNAQVQIVQTGSRRNIFVAVVLAPGDRHTLPICRIFFAKGATGTVTTRFGFTCGCSKLTQGDLRALHDKGVGLQGFSPKQWGGGSELFWSKPVRLTAR